MRWYAIPLVFVIMGMAATSVEAQKQDETRAREHFIAAQAHEEQGAYEAAALEYLQAYEYFPSPEFFFNAGRAYELHGDPARAVEYYERYIALEPNGRAVDSARAAIVKLKPQVEAEQRLAEEPGVHASTSETRTHDTTEAPVAEPDQARDGADEQSEPVGETVPNLEGGETDSPESRTAGNAMAVRAPRDEGSRSVRIAGMVAAGVGLVATAVGVKYAMDASRLSDEIENVQDQWTDQNLAKFDEGERARTMSITLTGIGIAALLAGGGLYFWGRGDGSADAPERTSLLPVISPNGTGFVVTRRF